MDDSREKLVRPKDLLKHFMIVIFFSFYLPSAVAAAEDEWSAWLRSEIESYPEIVAAKEEMQAYASLAEASAQPLYNPELETSFDRKGSDNNFRLGLNQTVDWWDKRGTRKEQGRFRQAEADQAYAWMLQVKTAEALKALVQWQSAKQESLLALEQEKQLGELLALLDRRQNMGDLGAVDAELAFLSLTKNLNLAAAAQANLKEAESALSEILPSWTSSRAKLPDSLWQPLKFGMQSQWLDEHPSVAAAKQKWLTVQQSAQLISQENKAEPTFGISAGQEDEEKVVGVTFSLPLNVRNNFSHERRAANQQSLVAEAQYRAKRRKQSFAIKASLEVLQQYQQRIEHRELLMQGRRARSEDLIDKAWKSGDLSTNEYLLALQQRSESLIAGIELNTQYQLARIESLLQSGQLSKALHATANP